MEYRFENGDKVMFLEHDEFAKRNKNIFVDEIDDEGIIFDDLEETWDECPLHHQNKVLVVCNVRELDDEPDITCSFFLLHGDDLILSTYNDDPYCCYNTEVKLIHREEKEKEHE